MAAPTYVNYSTPPIDAGNLNEINTVIYGLMGSGGNPPINDSDIRTNIGLGNVDNTSDVNKPVSTAQAAAISAAVTASAGRLIGVQSFTSTGVYTPTAGTTRIIVELQGAAGGSAGCVATPAGQFSFGSSGGGGAYCKSFLTSGFSGQTVTIGAAGAAGGAGTSGGAGGATTFLTMSAGGGGAGTATATAASGAAGPGAPGVATGGNILNINGQTASGVNWASGGAPVLTVPGANSVFGNGGPVSGGTGPALAGNGFGAAGGWALNYPSTAAQVGVAGRPGVAYIYEYS